MLEKYEKSYICDEIEKLDEWFDCLTKDDNITVHAIESHTVYGTVVFWSDVKGYSYSYKSYCGCGISGCYHSLIGCVGPTGFTGETGPIGETGPTGPSQSFLPLRGPVAGNTALTDDDCVLLSVGTQVGVTVTLPISHSAGRRYYVMNAAATNSETVTIDAGMDLIVDTDGSNSDASTLVITGRQTAHLISDGSSWYQLQ